MIKSERDVATYFLIGYQKGWNFMMLSDALGVQIGDLMGKYKFLPSEFWAVKKSIRSFVATQWPKLSEYLIKHEKDPARMNRVIDQVVRLKSSSDRYGMSRSAEDAKEFAATGEEIRRVNAANRLARDIQKSTQRGAWNVCKG